MLKEEEVVCRYCEAEFYIQHDDEVRFCCSCGEPTFEIDEIEIDDE